MTDFPFRWDISRRNQLGTLLDGERAEAYPNFLRDLLPCCARVLAFGGDSDLLFVGRSPESIFDHLSGLLFDTSWSDRLTLLHFSMSFQEESAVRKEWPRAIHDIRRYLTRLRLDPESIATRDRTVTLVDLVYSGDTFGRFITLLFNWSEEIHFDWKAVRRRLRLLGITYRTKTSPKTWRWQQHCAWVKRLEVGSVKNVSIPGTLWGYLGNDQEKVSLSYPPWRWGDPAAASPGRSDEQLRALRLAYDLFDLGRTRERREEFAAILTKERAMKDEWFRRLVAAL